MRRYAVLSKETVRTFAESAGHSSLSDEVTEILAEDVSYRLRDLIKQSCEFMKNAKRRKMLTRDFFSALRNSDIQPIYGHSFSEPLTVCQTKEADIFFYNDPEVNLPNFGVSAQVVNHTGRTVLKGTWLAVEGTKTGSSLPQTVAQGKASERSPKPLSEDALLYFDVITRAILGADEQSMRMALKDLNTNSRLLPLLPYLVNFVANGVKTVSHDTAQLGRLLHTVKALVLNPFVYLEPKPYLTMIVQTIEYCGIEPLAASINPQNDHWALRDYASRLLGLTTRRLDCAGNRLRKLNLETLREVLSDNSRPFCTHYGAVMGILAMGMQAVHEIIVPLLPSYFGHLEESLSDCSSANAVVKSDAQKVNGALLLVAEYIVRAHVQLMTSSSNAENVLESGFDRMNSVSLSTCSSVFAGDRDSFSVGDSLAIESKNLASSSSSFLDVYSKLYEYFGDSLAARLPNVPVLDFYESKGESDAVVSFADEDTCRTGEELLQRFLEQPSSSKRSRLEKDGVMEDNRTPDDTDLEDKSNMSVCSGRSSDGNHSYVGDDTDLTIKATVSDPSRGIKLTILKRPKTAAAAPQLTSPVSSLPSLWPQVSGSVKSVSKIQSKSCRSSLPKSTLKSDVFELTHLKERDVIFVFSFQGRVQHCVFSERQKALILARDMALQHAAVSKYRSMCSALPNHGKLQKLFQMETKKEDSFAPWCSGSKSGLVGKGSFFCFMT